MRKQCNINDVNGAFWGVSIWKESLHWIDFDNRIAEEESTNLTPNAVYDLLLH